MHSTSFDAGTRRHAQRAVLLNLPLERTAFGVRSLSRYAAS